MALPPVPPDKHRIWFIDEITGVKGDWAATIKWLRDNNADFSRATVVLTGSSAQGLSQAIGVLAGRRGKIDHADRTLMPIGFRQFTATWYPAIDQLPRLRLDQLHSQTGADAYQQTMIWLDELVSLWELYLQYGGFPVAVAAAKKGEPTPSWFIDALFDVVLRDAFANSLLDEWRTTSLFSRLWESLATPINLRKIGDDAGVDGATVSRHITYLRNAYLLWECPRLDKKWVPLDKAQPKIYPVDPLIARLAYLRNPGRSDIDITILSEAQLGMALRRAALHAETRWSADEGLFYERTKQRYEIDFVADALGDTAVESKYIDSGRWHPRTQTIEAAGYNGLFATRSVLETSATDAPWAVPTAILAAVID